MSSFDDVLNADGMPERKLFEDIKELIIRAESERPRSLQRVPGPSEVGHPCERKLAYTINRSRSTVDKPEHNGYNRNSDPMAAIIGTATHTWLEDAANKDNERLGRVRWVTEQKVVVRQAHQEREQLAGTCDLYDFDTKTCIDWKVPGATMYAGYVKNGPSAQYRAQAHMYGQGFINLGFPVENIGIFFISRTGTLRQTHLWREPYDQTVVNGVLNTLNRVEDTMLDLDVVDRPGGFTQFDKTPGDYCRYCPWWSPKPTGPFECAGPDA